MIIGYARVSTDDQSLNLQRDALQKAGCERIYEDRSSGKNDDRVELQYCLKSLRQGDSLVVWRLDRLGRSLIDLIKIVSNLEKSDVCFVSINEAIATNTASGKLIFHIFASLAEFERSLITERTKAGLASARARGRKGGRKPSLDDKQIKEIKALMKDKSIQVTTIAKRYDVSRATLYKYAKD
jgi:DNA invertase Pin-like site-specific DNA recombinase